MTLDNRLHFVTRVIRVGLTLVVPMVEEDGEKGGESRGSVRAVTVPGTASSSGTVVTKYCRGLVSVQGPTMNRTYKFPG